MIEVDLEATRGDDESYNLRLIDEAKAPLDLSAADIWFTIKTTLDTDDASAVIQKTVGDGITVTNAAGGLARVDIAADDWDAIAIDGESLIGYWDLQIKTGGRVTTVGRGRFLIENDVTLSDS